MRGRKREKKNDLDKIDKKIRIYHSDVTQDVLRSLGCFINEEILLLRKKLRQVFFAGS